MTTSTSKQQQTATRLLVGQTELAELLGVSYPTIARWADSGYLASLGLHGIAPVGDPVRFGRRQVEALVHHLAVLKPADTYLMQARRTPLLVTQTEVARILGYARPTIARWMDSGYLESLGLHEITFEGEPPRFRRAEVDDLVRRLAPTPLDAA